MPRTVSPMFCPCRIEGNGRSITRYIPKEFATKGNVFKFTTRDPKGNIIVNDACVMDVGVEMPFDTVLARGFQYIHKKFIVMES